jgi:hypothetical protein
VNTTPEKSLAAITISKHWDGEQFSIQFGDNDPHRGTWSKCPHQHVLPDTRCPGDRIHAIMYGTVAGRRYWDGRDLRHIALKMAKEMGLVVSMCTTSTIQEKPPVPAPMPLVHEFMGYCAEHYEEGWSPYLEAYTVEELAEYLGGCTTLDEAIERGRPLAELFLEVNGSAIPRAEQPVAATVEATELAVPRTEQELTEHIAYLNRHISGTQRKLDRAEAGRRVKGHTTTAESDRLYQRLRDMNKELAATERDLNTLVAARHQSEDNERGIQALEAVSGHLRAINAADGINTPTATEQAIEQEITERRTEQQRTGAPKTTNILITHTGQNTVSITYASGVAHATMTKIGNLVILTYGAEQHTGSTLRRAVKALIRSKGYSIGNVSTLPRGK